MVSGDLNLKSGTSESKQYFFKRMHLGYKLFVSLFSLFQVIPVLRLFCLALVFSFTFRFLPAQEIRYDRLIPLSIAYTGLYFGSMAYLQWVWYDDKERVPFNFYDDSRGYKQIDKMGHTYGAWLESYIGVQSLKWAGVSSRKAAWIGGSMGFFMQLPIEIWDGMYEGWGFSWSDVGANAFGSALVISQELLFQDQPLKYKFSFSPSPYAKQANGYLGNGFNELFYDYNGHTYWFTLGLKRIFSYDFIPSWLDLALGYSAGGMFGEFENRTSYRGVPIPETIRYRQFLLSFDIDFSKIKTRHGWLQSIFNNMFLIKVPFPTLEYNTKGEVKFHPLYY